MGTRGVSLCNQLLLPYCQVGAGNALQTDICFFWKYYGSTDNSAISADRPYGCLERYIGKRNHTKTSNYLNPKKEQHFNGILRRNFTNPASRQPSDKRDINTRQTKLVRLKSFETHFCPPTQISCCILISQLMATQIDTVAHKSNKRKFVQTKIETRNHTSKIPISY